MNGEWFGDPWPSEMLRAPVCEDDNLRVETPLGSSCSWCDELVDEGDRGSFITVVKNDSTVEERPIHMECSIRSVVGPVAFLEGRCKHANPPGDDPCHDEALTPRQDALLTYEWIKRHGTIR